jgi:YihY family inner membrane protein
MAFVTQAAGGVITRIDGLQRRRPIIGFPYAVFKRYGEDHGGWLGSLISYYGFFSLYPLLVVFATVATWVFEDRPETLQRVLQALWSKVPFASGTLSAEVEEQVRSLDGHSPTLILSLIVTLWGGVGVVRVLQDAVNTIWGVPRFRRPGFLSKLARGLMIIGLLGLGVIGTAVVAGITLAVDLPIVAAVAAALGNVALSAGIAIALYHIIIGTSVRTAEIVPGALITAVGSYVVTLVGGLYVKNVIARMTGVYGPFATTIGLLTYVSLMVQIFVFGTEVNVVRARSLWPRAMGSELGPGDFRAIELTMRREALSAAEILPETPTTA